MWKFRTPGIGRRYFSAPAMSSSAALGFFGSVQKMTTWENMLVGFECSRRESVEAEKGLQGRNGSRQCAAIREWVNFPRSDSLRFMHFASPALDYRWPPTPVIP